MVRLLCIHIMDVHAVLTQYNGMGTCTRQNVSHQKKDTKTNILKIKSVILKCFVSYVGEILLLKQKK